MLTVAIIGYVKDNIEEEKFLSQNKNQADYASCSHGRYFLWRVIANLESSKLVVKAGMISFDISLILLVKQYTHTFL